MASTEKMAHLSPAMRESLETASEVCNLWNTRPRDNVKINEAVGRLDKCLAKFALGDIRPAGIVEDTRQPFATDRRQHGGI